MDDFNIDNSPHDLSYSNITSGFVDSSSDYEYNKKVEFIMMVVTCIIISICFSLTIVAIYALITMVRNGQVAPLFIINLLISDLFQLCCLIVEVVSVSEWSAWRCGYIISLMVSLGFMVCISMERCFAIACPLWYRFRRPIIFSAAICIMVWAIPIVFFFTVLWPNYPRDTHLILAVSFLLPFPFFIFFLAGTLKALSASCVPSNEKRRIVGILVLVLLIYTVLFLPGIICLLVEWSTFSEDLFNVSFMFLKLNPLADLLLYVFIKKGLIDKLLASVCCCRMDSDDDISRPTV